ncbi:MAG: PQQ-binding-like beta-propeller repeat protein [Treponema sp.]|jgi:outer membrane protein assembly factor BamB|nr:PQQ-binding-like beta-propeller repeat protein [Treponema sp.]
MTTVKEHPELQRLLCGLAFIIFLYLASPLEAQETSPYVWRQAPGGAVLGPPVAQEESVTVVCDGGNLISYSGRGDLLWKYNARGRLAPYVSRSPEGTCYICRTNGVLIAVNRAGRELWRKNVGTAISSPVLVGRDGRIFVFTSQRVRCFTASGYPLWSRYLTHPAALPPRLDRAGGILLVLEDQELVEISPFGRIVTRPLAAMPAAVVPLDPFPQERGEPVSEGKPALIFTRDGAAAVSRWGAPAISLPSPGGVPLAAEGRGDKAAATLSNGALALLSLPGGETLWSGETHIAAGEDAGEVRILYDERGIYILSRSGATGFTEDGRRLWIIRIEGASSAPAFSDDGFLYSGGKDWILYAYRPEERIRRLRRSFYGSFPEDSYGTANPRPSFRAEGYIINLDDGEIKARLSHIDRLIRAGTVGADEREFTAYLMELADSLGAYPSRETLLHPPVRPDYRAEALMLLGFLGSRETIPFLADLYIRDREGAIKAAAAEAIGRIGVDPEGHALRAFSALAFPPSSYQNETVLAATAAAAGALCRFSGPPLSEMGIRLLVALGQDGRPLSVQRRALTELASLVK